MTPGACAMMHPVHVLRVAHVLMTREAAALVTAAIACCSRLRAPDAGRQGRHHPAAAAAGGGNVKLELRVHRDRVATHERQRRPSLCADLQVCARRQMGVQCGEEVKVLHTEHAERVGRIVKVVHWARPRGLDCEPAAAR